MARSASDTTPTRSGRALRRVPVLAASSLLLCTLAVSIAAPESAGFVSILRATGDALLWQAGPLDFHDELGHLDEAIGVAGLITLAWCAYLLFRPLAVPRVLPGIELRRAARELVRRHGDDTLAYFKLRRDQHYLFSPDRRAFLGYRVEAGVLLVSGDPVGSDDAIPSLLRELSHFAETRGLRIAALGAGESMRPLWEQLGLRSMYLGDEAVVETGSFSLEGRPIRKVRQSVTRLEKQGYTAELASSGSSPTTELGELEAVSRQLARGQSRARLHDVTRRAAPRRPRRQPRASWAGTATDTARGFLHFAPSYGRAAVSLSLMRRRRDTPNGLMEFLVARGLELLRDRGVQRPRSTSRPSRGWSTTRAARLERLVGRALLLADAFFQIERLYRFNAKFFPRWEPRYLMYERRLGFPRVGLAALWVEGQLPKPGSRRR